MAGRSCHGDGDREISVLNRAARKDLLCSRHKRAIVAAVEMEAVEKYDGEQEKLMIRMYL